MLSVSRLEQAVFIGWRWEKGEEMGDICNSLNNKEIKSVVIFLGTDTLVLKFL